MKTIGLLGGTSWASTIDYYRDLNERAQAYFGAPHSAELILKSVDYAPLVSRYENDWETARALFADRLAELEAMGPDCLVICCNTLHRALDELDVAQRPALPVIHMVDVTAAAARGAGHDRVLLLGTRFTMENGYYANRLAATGLDVTIPNADDRDVVQGFQQRASQGQPVPEAPGWFARLWTRHADCGAAVLACTELPGLIEARDAPLALLDPLTLQCDAAFAWAVG
ncbi:amino acid racemase [uncultured Salinisphaera sp.]|uniref:aspartate/glutamate racemase family protein n=1 Tax=uncultured Salinisphaera sp. TaxID=359372 RepID=UPI0032B232BA|tara:strand:+ start:1452 stop:2135 length:684 start_codon:yes stop_codon:yes gene_type:complete